MARTSSWSLARRISRAVRRYAPAVAFFGVILLIWEMASLSGGLPRYLLPAPSAIVNQMIVDGPILIRHTNVTVLEIILGFALGSLIGFVLAIGIVYSRFLENVVYPIALFTQTIPKLAIAPLFIIWLGFGLLPKIAITALICLFPVLINTVAGLRSVDSRLLDLMHSLSANRWQVFSMIRLPHAMPHIFAGLEIGVTLAVIGAIVGEWVGANEGLGYLMLMATSQLATERLFGAIVAISVVGLVAFFAMIGAERVLLPHRPHVRGSGQESL